MALVVGCGGGDSPSGGGTRAPGTTTADRGATTDGSGGGGPLVATLGDSITAGAPLYDPDPAVRAQIGPALDERSQYQYWLRRSQPGVRIRNCGVSGERTDEIAQRLDACVRGAQVLIVQGGVNDIAQDRPVPDVADDLRSMIRAGTERGLRVAVVELLPWNNGFPAAAPFVAELNRRIRGIAQDEGVPVYSWYAALEDPEAPGRMRQEMTIDGDHPSVAGYRRLAETITLPR